MERVGKYKEMSKVIQKYNLFDEPINLPTYSLTSKDFLFPPFSVFNAREGK